MKVKTFLGGYDNNLCYLVWCESTKISAMIDASTNTREIFSFIKNHNLVLEKIFITHTHSDHIKYLNDVLCKFPEINIYGY